VLRIPPLESCFQAMYPMDPAISEAIRTMNLKWARCHSAEGVLNGRRLRRGIVRYLRTATYEIELSILCSKNCHAGPIRLARNPMTQVRPRGAVSRVCNRVQS
jgi:hypothetical protein